jgi:uncharacterized protein (TIGR03437 family)
MIGGVEAKVSFSGLAPRTIGLYQINAEVPTGLAPSNALPVLVRMSDVRSNILTVALE